MADQPQDESATPQWQATQEEKDMAFAALQQALSLDTEGRGIDASGVKRFTNFRGQRTIHHALYLLKAEGKIKSRKSGTPVLIERFYIEEGR